MLTSHRGSCPGTLCHDLGDVGLAEPEAAGGARQGPEG